MLLAVILLLLFITYFFAAIGFIILNIISTLLFKTEQSRKDEAGKENSIVRRVESNHIVLQLCNIRKKKQEASRFFIVNIVVAV